MEHGRFKAAVLRSLQAEEKSENAAAVANGDEKKTDSMNYSWHEVGTGPLKVLQTKQTDDDDDAVVSHSRLVQRRESSPGGPATIVILNLRLLSAEHTTIETPSEKHVKVATAVHTTTNTAATTTDTSNNCTTAQPLKPGIFLFKFKLASEAAKLVDCLEKIVRSSTTNDTNSDDKNEEES